MAAIDETTGTIARPEARTLQSVRKGYTPFTEGDVIFAKITPCMENGKSAIARNLVNGIGFGTTELHVIRPFDGVLPEYIYYFVRQKKFREEAAQHMTGAVGQLRVPPDFIKNAVIPLPSTVEQERIVHVIKNLMQQIALARTAQKSIPSILRKLRQSLLAQAFRGELTQRDPNDEPAENVLERIRQERQRRWEEELRAKHKDPRKFRFIEHGPLIAKPFDLPDGWQWTTIGSIFEVAVGGTPSRKNLSYWNGKIPWVSSGEVAFRRIRSTRERITTEGMKNSSAKIRPVGTVLLAMIGEGKTRGQAAILDIPAATNQNVASILCSETPILPEYTYSWFYYRYNETRSVGEGGAQPALNAPRVRSIPIPVAPFHEQKIIASKIEKLLAYADDVEKSVKLAYDRAQMLESSLLAKAFRGGLAPQDPNDEPASVLLERIRPQRVTMPKKTRHSRAELAIPVTITSEA
jgi:type I restriction enzyme S subunit